MNDFRILIVSRGRSQNIITHKFLPVADIVVPESEVEEYKHTGNNIIPLPDGVLGLAKTRNWVLDNFKEFSIFMFDDDIKKMTWNCDVRTREMSIEELLDMLQVTALMSREAGSPLVSFTSRDARHYSAIKPFSFNRWAGTVLGINGREFRFDEKLKTKVDADFSLQVLLKNRFIWSDNRIGYDPAFDTNTGGLSIIRTSKVVGNDIRYLKLKWGDHINFKSNKNGSYILSLDVQRTQKLNI